MSAEIYRGNNLNITSFYGGEKRGKCIQITFGLGSVYVGSSILTRTDVIELIKNLTEWCNQGTFYDSQE